MENEIYKVVKNLHDCSVDKIEIKQSAFSEDCPPDYPKDYFEIKVRIMKDSDYSIQKFISFAFSDIQEFSIKKTDSWNWLIFESDLLYKDGFYIFRIDDYIKIVCSSVIYKIE